MNSYFTTFKINDHIYQIKEKMGVLATLVIGREKAMLIDTGYGIYNLKEYISNITNLPLIVIASHGHMDHTGGNYLFDEIYIHKKDIELCQKHNSIDRRTRNINAAIALNCLPDNFNKDKYLQQGSGNLKTVEYGAIFDLGGITIEVINMEGHTAGSIGLYIKEDNYLVVTDATCPFIWIFLEESLSVATYIKMLENVLTLPFTDILVGHGKGALMKRERVLEFLKVAKEIDMNKAVKVSFQNFENANSYCYTEGIMYNQDHSGIVFDPNKLK